MLLENVLLRNSTKQPHRITLRAHAPTSVGEVYRPAKLPFETSLCSETASSLVKGCSIYEDGTATGVNGTCPLWEAPTAPAMRQSGWNLGLAK